jgi:phenylalanyl-tRNA synthetase beta chain
MRFSDSWLRDMVETRLAPREIGERLTQVGIPLDSLETRDDDTIYHFDVTTNRPDCMNHLGLGREISVAEGTRLKEPVCELPGPSRQPGAGPVSVRVEAADLCSRYTALIVEQVNVGPSPRWLSNRLESIGLRPINAVVDATNYVLWEMGQPLHAFDLARLSGRAIRVRRAKPGERLVTLDGLERKLDAQMLVIADANRPVALAGVLGGKESEISSATTEVLLESAHFQPAVVRRMARRLGVHTDASHRFERGADPEITQKAALRCGSLIAAATGGKLAAVLDERPTPAASRTVSLRPERVRRLLGLEVPVQAMRDILTRLGCRIETDQGPAWRVIPPSFRGDLGLEEDLIEEIARHHGYDKIPITLPRVFIFPEGRSVPGKNLDRVRLAARRGGFSEALNLSLVSESDNRAFGDSSGGVRILNPLAEGQDRLRASLLPGLLRNLSHNLNHHLPEARLFESGKIFRAAASEGQLPDEEEKLALVLGGKATLRHWTQPERQPDFFDLKGALDLAAGLLALPAPRWKPARLAHLADGRGAEMFVADQSMGWAGELTPEATSAYGLETATLAAEISLRRLFSLLSGPPQFRHTPLSRTPSVSRDLALVLEKSHPYAQVEEVIREVEGIPVALVELFDRYEGASIPAGKVGLAIRLTFRSPERTLVSEEVSEHLNRIIQRLHDRLGAVLRGN